MRPILNNSVDRKIARGEKYTKEEFEKRLQERKKEHQQQIKDLDKIAQNNKMDHLSFMISAPGALYFSGLLDLKESDNLLIAYIAPTGNPDERPIVKWVERRNTAMLSEATIQEMVASLEKSVGAETTKSQ